MKLIVTFLMIATALAQPQPCPNDQLCAKCQNSVCAFCWHGFIANGTCAGNRLDVINCLSYSYDGFCQLCATGYYPNQVGQCIAITQANCAVYDLIQTCTSCNDTIRVNNGTCASTNAMCSTTNCQHCDSLDICRRCKPGYSLTSAGLCVQAVNTADNCDLRTDSGCARCMYGYYDNNGSCVRSGNFKSASILTSVLAGLMFVLCLGY